MPAKGIIIKNEKATIQELNKKGVEYIGMKLMDKENKKVEDKIKDFAKPVVRELGTKDLQGHIVLETDDVEFKIEKRIKPFMKEDVVHKILEKKKLLAEAQVLVIDPDRVQGLMLEGKLSEKEVEKMFGETVVEAFYVRARKK